MAATPAGNSEDAPPLRGWATSPDVLLRLHTHIMATRPQVIVEFGSGASTLVIADALRQNGTGKLISIEHSGQVPGCRPSARCRQSAWKAGSICVSVTWKPKRGERLNPEDAEKPSRWYPVSLLEGIRRPCIFYGWTARPVRRAYSVATRRCWYWLTSSHPMPRCGWMTPSTGREGYCERWAADHGFGAGVLPVGERPRPLNTSRSETSAYIVSASDKAES